MFASAFICRHIVAEGLETVQVTVGHRREQNSSAGGSYLRQRVHHVRCLWSCESNDCAHLVNCGMIASQWESEWRCSHAHSAVDV